MTKQPDLSYRDEGLFTCFVPNTAQGETAWNELAAKNDGVGKVLTIHANATIQQLKAAGYNVSKARKVSLDDISDGVLLAELCEC